MRQCSHCEGFVPAQAIECPHCDATLPAAIEEPKVERLFGRWGWGKKVAAAASAGAVMFTMMACYGMPPCQMEDKDKDGFGVCVGGGYAGGQQDCDDNNADIHPGAKDTEGDGIDQNCDNADGDVSSPSSGTP